MKTREQKLEYKRNYMKKWNKLNAEKLREKRKAKQKELALKTKNWYKENPNYHKEWRRANPDKVKKARHRYRITHMTKEAEDSKKWARKNLTSVMITSARKRARENNIPFDITKNDIIIPEICPILGIPIIPNNGRGPCDNSPSLDRIISYKGYVKGNVIVISYRANRIKNDGSAEELQKIATWLFSNQNESRTCTNHD